MKLLTWKFVYSLYLWDFIDNVVKYGDVAPQSQYRGNMVTVIVQYRLLGITL